jgi:hypothetical protein
MVGRAVGTRNWVDLLLDATSPARFNTATLAGKEPQLGIRNSDGQSCAPPHDGTMRLANYSRDIYEL